LFKGFCEQKGIERQLTIPNTPQQNGVAERKNRTLLDMVRSMMAQANLDMSYWGDALLTAAYVLNRMPSKSVSSTPYELWTQRKPNLSNLRPWGCAAYVHNTKSEFGKLGPKGKKCVFLRYCEHSKGYVFADLEEGSKRAEFDSRDAIFLENEFPRKENVNTGVSFYEMSESQVDNHNVSTIPTPQGVFGNVGLSGSIEHPTEVGQDVTNNDQNIDQDMPTQESDQIDQHQELVEDDQPPEQHDDAVHHEASPSVRRSSRIFRRPKKWWILNDEVNMVSPEVDDEPRTIKDALSSPDSDKWKMAMEEELNSMRDNHVWDLVDLPQGRKAIGNKWVFRIKRKADGSIDRYKARLVAKGYTQVEGVDYQDTFSPVVRFNSVRVILAIVAHMDLELHQMDVKTAFLNGDLSEEIYMTQPAGYVVKGQEQKVCHLMKSIYGLKQASRQWYLKFHQSILNYGFKMMDEDHCVYVLHSKDKFVIMSLYVDDILLASNNKGFLKVIKGWLSSTFEMKDMGEAAYILGVQILRNRATKLLALSQETYIDKILERFHMKDAKPMNTPIAHNAKISESMCPQNPQEKHETEQVPY